MAIYRENKEKLRKTLLGHSTVRLTVNCYLGTIVNVETQDVEFTCAESKAIGDEVQLKGNRIKVTGTPRTPEGEEIRVEHIFDSPSGTKTYTFPDDYTGSPPYNPTDTNVTYIFYMNFD